MHSRKRSEQSSIAKRKAKKEQSGEGSEQSFASLKSMSRTASMEVKESMQGQKRRTRVIQIARNQNGQNILGETQTAKRTLYHSKDLEVFSLLSLPSSAAVMLLTAGFSTSGGVLAAVEEDEAEGSAAAFSAASAAS